VGVGAPSAEPVGAVQQRDGDMRCATLQSTRIGGGALGTAAHLLTSERAGGTLSTVLTGGAGGTADEGGLSRTQPPLPLRDTVPNPKGPVVGRIKAVSEAQGMATYFRSAEAPRGIGNLEEALPPSAPSCRSFQCRRSPCTEHGRITSRS
jgi:hypothetical protein